MRKRKSESEFKYSIRLLEARQAKLQAEIGRIEAEGYSVPKAVKAQVANMTNVRSTRQARQYLNLYKVTRVRNAARYTLARQEITGTTKLSKPLTPKAGQPDDITIPSAKYGKAAPTLTDKAAKMLKDMSYEFRYHPSLKGADTMQKALQDLERATGVKLLERPEGTPSAWNARHMPETISKITPEKLAEAIEKMSKTEPDFLPSFVNKVYERFNTSEKSYAAKMDVAHQISLASFMDNNKFSESEAETLYEFFKNNKAWNDFRKKHSENYNLHELLDFINVKDKIDKDAMATAIGNATTGTISDLISHYNEAVASAQ